MDSRTEVFLSKQLTELVQLKDVFITWLEDTPYGTRARAVEILAKMVDALSAVEGVIGDERLHKLATALDVAETAGTMMGKSSRQAVQVDEETRSWTAQSLPRRRNGGFPQHPGPEPPGRAEPGYSYRAWTEYYDAMRDYRERMALMMGDH